MDKDNIKIGDLVTWSDPYFINMSINKTNMTKNIVCIQNKIVSFVP